MNKLLAWFYSGNIPVPPSRDVPDRMFAETLRASLSLGSVSMGVGKMFTKDDHDRLYQSLKDYRFSESPHPK